MKQITLSRMLRVTDLHASPFGITPCHDYTPEIPADRRSEYWIC